MFINKIKNNNKATMLDKKLILIRSLPSPTITSLKYKNILILTILMITIIKHSVNGSILIGALFHNNEGNNNNITSTTLETDEEIVFKHAVYISNQYKLAFLNAPPDYPTLLHRIIHLSRSDQQLNTIKKICKHTNGNMLAMIGPRNDNSLKMYVKSLCEQLDVLHFDIEPSFDRNINSFNFYPSLEVLCHAFSDLIKKFEWTHAAVIYNSRTSCYFELNLN
jgi:hypothetical protein